MRRPGGHSSGNGSRCDSRNENGSHDRKDAAVDNVLEKNSGNHRPVADFGSQTPSTNQPNDRPTPFRFISPRQGRFHVG